MRLFLTLLTYLLIAQPALAAVEIGMAAVVRGEVYVERNANKQELKAKDKIYQGDKITTGEKAKVQLIFADDTIFTIGRTAEVLLDKYVYDPATNTGESEVKATKGTFKFVTGKIAKTDPKHVKVKTPFATIGVRGSGGLVDVAPNGMTRVGLTQCCLDIFANGAPPGTPPVPLNNVNSFSQVEDPTRPPTPPAPMPPAMVAQMNGDLNGGFAPVEGEDDGIGSPLGDGGQQPPEGDEGNGDGGPNEGDPNQPGEKQGPEGGDEGNEGGNPPPPGGEGGQPLVEGDNPPPPPEGSEGGFADAGAPPPPPPGDTTFGDGGFDNFGTFDSAGGGDLLLAGGTGTDGGFLLDPLSPEGDGGVTGDGLNPPPPPEVDTTQTTQDGTASDTITSSTSGPATHIGVFKRKNVNETIVREGDLSGSTGTGQFLGNFVDFDGSTFSGALPIPGTSGNFTQPDFGFGGVIFSGNGYKTANNDYLLYDLSSAAGDKLYVAAGTEILVPTTGVDEFTFRADPFSSDAQTTTTTTDEGGLIVDWARKKYLGGNIEIKNTTATDFRYSAVAGFGDVLTTPTATGTNAMGIFVDLQKESANGALRDTIIATGTTEAVEIFGTGTEVSGFILDIDKENGNLPTGNTLNHTEYSINPIVRAADDPQTVAGITAFNAAKSLRGFLGGYIMKVNGADGSAEAFDRITNRVTNGQVDGGISMYLNPNGNGSADLSGWTGAGDFYDVDFGADAGGDSAVITDQAYALEQVHSTVNRFNIFVGATGSVSATSERTYAFDRDGNSLSSWNHVTAAGPGLVAPDGTYGDAFGKVTAAYGNIAIVGAPYEEHDANTDAGAVYLYNFDNGSWGYWQKLIASDTTGADNFGSAIGIHNDLAIIGAPMKATGGGSPTVVGGAYIYKLNPTASTWAETPILASDGAASDLFGASVDVFGDYAVVGAHGANTSTGAVYIYKWNGSAWVENQKILGEAASNAFGYSVAMDDDLVVVGAPNVNTVDGKIYIYRRNAATGQYGLENSFTAVASSGTGGNLGTYVDVQDNTVVASAPNVASSQGIVSVFQYNGTWSFESNITAGDAAAGANFGTGVRITNNVITVGATGATGDAAGSGAFYVYEHQPQTGGSYAWIEVVQSQGANASDIAGSNVGASVAFSGAVISTQDDGALISESLADVSIQCTACDYVHWGVWAGKLDNTETLSSAGSAIADLIPYVAGEITDATSLNGFTGTANYTGITVGSVLNQTANTLSHHTGTMTAAVDFSTRDVDITASLGAYNFTANGAGSLWSAGTNAFTITSLSGTGGTTISIGEVNGAFFGPNAQDIGGNFSFGGPGYSAAGVYLGNDATR